jgi:3-phosphoshikimate 1-carboxyvinyltransferase
MADLVVRHRPLQGVRVPAALVPIAIDEFPALLAAAAFATGRTVVTGAGELRVKESDRIAAMAEGLAAMGITAVEQPDGIEVSGGAPVGAHIESRGDHRIAMAFAVAGLAAAGETHIMDCRNIDTSFPGFGASVRAVGGDLG